MSIYQHFRPEEKEFIDHALNWIEQVKDSYAPKLTDFLDPRQQQILSLLLGQDRWSANRIFWWDRRVRERSEHCYFQIIIRRNKVIFNYVYLKLSILKNLLL